MLSGISGIVVFPNVRREFALSNVSSAVHGSVQGSAARVMPLSSFGQPSNTCDMISAMRRDGAIIAENWIPDSLASAVASDLRSVFDEAGQYQFNDFNGYKTLRINRILGNSAAVAGLLQRQQLLEIADEILLPFCLAYRFGSLTGIEILPGEAAQALHRDDQIYPVRMPGVEWQISVMWALDDFTFDNGATRVVPGSHRWMELHSVDDEDVLQAAMPRGSALVYLGSTLHGGGANVSNRSRMGLVITYSLGWLRQEENLYVKIPRQIAQGYPVRVQELIGYKKHGEKLGWF